jgi:hypothetical protein
MNGKNLIFLISQPRAGSTLLQRILGAHSSIHTQSEPWVMLHPLSALIPDSLVAVYNADWSRRALQDFISLLPGGMEKYRSSLAAAYEGFYQSILRRVGKERFLDKTPRYYMFVNELAEFFPEAKIIFLFRNPAAVISSIIRTWANSEPHKLADYKTDLLCAPGLITGSRRALGERAYSLRYEDLLVNPEESVRKICDYLDLPYETSMLAYNTGLTERWKYGDQGTVYTADGPDPIHIDSWTEELADPRTRRLISDYVRHVGKNIMEEMGYSYEDAMRILDDHKPVSDMETSVPSLTELLDNRQDTEERNLILNMEVNGLKMKLQDTEERNLILNMEVNGLKMKLQDTERLLQDKDWKLKTAEETLRITRGDLEEALSSKKYLVGKIILWPLFMLKRLLTSRRKRQIAGC